MSCLFDSLSKFINMDSQKIRNIICDYLENNYKIMEDLDTELILALSTHTNSKVYYIRNMRHTNTWGSAIEIQAACNIWKLRIFVVNKRDNDKIIDFIPVSKEYNHNIGLIWYGNHYEPANIIFK